MSKLIKQFFSDEQGQDLKEYALLLLFLALGTIATEYLANRLLPATVSSSSFTPRFATGSGKSRSAEVPSLHPRSSVATFPASGGSRAVQTEHTN